MFGIISDMFFYNISGESSGFPRDYFCFANTLCKSPKLKIWEIMWYIWSHLELRLLSGLIAIAPRFYPSGVIQGQIGWNMEAEVENNMSEWKKKSDGSVYEKAVPNADDRHPN